MVSREQHEAGADAVADRDAQPRFGGAGGAVAPMDVPGVCATAVVPVRGDRRDRGLCFAGQLGSAEMFVDAKGGGW